MQVIAERGRHCPEAVRAFQPAIDEKARADVRRGIDEAGELFMRERRLAREVMVEVEDVDSRGEQGFEAPAIAVEGDVENGDAIAGPGIDAVQQPDVALGAGDQRRLVARLREADLVQGADSVGVAVENVDPGQCVASARFDEGILSRKKKPGGGETPPGGLAEDRR
jgi:hypothetical protein